RGRTRDEDGDFARRSSRRKALANRERPHRREEELTAEDAGDAGEERETRTATSRDDPHGGKRLRTVSALTAEKKRSPQRTQGTQGKNERRGRRLRETILTAESACEP